jgi:hypothetical protein
MNKLLVCVLISFAFSMVKAQYNYAPDKIERIRWSPIPESVHKLNKIRLDLDGTWKFSSKPGKDFMSNPENQLWETIEVPGEWVMQGFTVEQGADAAYYTSFDLPEAWQGYRIKLKFEAVYSDCEIWLNGKLAGTHLGGFTPFEIDVTGHLQKGKNALTMAVKSESLADTLSSASKYAVHPLGGITRSVYLIAVPEMNIASFHVQTSFDTDYEDANLTALFTFANESERQVEAVLQVALYDANGNLVVVKGEQSIPVSISEHSIQKLSVPLVVEKPDKWDPEHPHLYYLHASLINNGKEEQKLVRRLGFRQVEVRGNKVFVNNRVIKLKGVCRHEAHPARGRSLTGDQWYEDVKVFKEGNVNYIRTSHYPPHEKLLEACDELGMFVEEEAPFCWASKKNINDSNYFEAILQPTLEMVERDKSHPSIILWSLANESHDFSELFKTSGKLVKEADPTRPRIFSQWSPQSDSGYLEIANHHYPGPDGANMYENSKRPMVFDEYCHLNAYNRFELMTDPGVRDHWGEGLEAMWESMYKTPAILGGALWAGIDDTFFLPDGLPVGYGTWGPLDGWRRKKPEFWHMKKVYSPVKIKLSDGEDNEPAQLRIENRYFFSNLNECTFKWKNDNQGGELQVAAEPGEEVIVHLPFLRKEMGLVTIQVFKDNDVPVDSYRFDFSPPELSWLEEEKATFKWQQKGSGKIAVSKHLKVEIENTEIKVFDTRGNTLLYGWPQLMMVPLNGEGAGIQMTTKTPEFTNYSPTAANRQVKSHRINASRMQLTIEIEELYDEAVGTMKYSIFADGSVEVTYNFVMLKEINPRQWGICFKVSNKLQQLNWSRKGQWSVYPVDHIGRNKGSAAAFNKYPKSKLAGPDTSPEWSWAQDQTNYGSNDFRSTKRNIFTASLLSPQNSGILIEGAGLQHIRAWHSDTNIKLLVAEYDNPGTENFFRSHAKLKDQKLKRGDAITGTIKLRVLND